MDVGTIIFVCAVLKTKSYSCILLAILGSEHRSKLEGDESVSPWEYDHKVWSRLAREKRGAKINRTREVMEA